jgi:hypothetical protein
MFATNGKIPEGYKDSRRLLKTRCNRREQLASSGYLFNFNGADSGSNPATAGPSHRVLSGTLQAEPRKRSLPLVESSLFNDALQTVVRRDQSVSLRA